MWINHTVVSELLRDERVAVAAYRALEDLGPDPLTSAQLRRIEHDHLEALNLIERQTLFLWEDPEEGGNVWRAWAPAIDAGAHHRAPDEAIESLAEGERHGVEDLKRALMDETLPFELQELIANRLLPKAQAHLGELERLRHRMALMMARSGFRGQRT